MDFELSEEERVFRQEVVSGGATPDIQRNIIAEQVLGLPTD